MASVYFYSQVDKVETFYQYLYDVAIPSLADMAVADHDYATPGSSHFLLGPWRLRQIRVKRGTLDLNGLTFVGKKLHFFFYMFHLLPAI